MHKYFIYVLTISSFIYSWESSQIYIPKINSIIDMNIYTGLDVLQISNFDILKNKNIGLVINHTSVNRYNQHILDLLSELNNIEIKKIFSPEHGLKGKLSAGEKYFSTTDHVNEIEFISLYGDKKKPSNENLFNIDMVVFDIQDIGSRYYTYVSTLTYILEACSENNIPVLILDRPNPLGGNIVKGPLLNLEYKSFVGLHPIPIVHGMSIGELAILINENKWYNSYIKADLVIFPCINWQRKDIYGGSKRGWISPSPNIPDLETAKLYSGFCLLEGTNLSEGRGTTSPFKTIGAPWINSDLVLSYINQNILYGIKLEKFEFTPIAINDMSKWPKYKNKKCFGFKLNIINDNSDPLKAIVELISIIQLVHKDKFKFLDNNFIDNLYGSKKLRLNILKNIELGEIFNNWEIDETFFNKQRSEYLIYN